MEAMTLQQLKTALQKRSADQRLKLTERSFTGLDLDGYDLHNVDFSSSLFRETSLNHVDLRGSSLENACLDGCSLHDSNFTNADLKTASMRNCDLHNSNFNGVNFYGAVLERADLKGVTTNQQTKWFALHCPASGPFVAFKKCFNDRIVQLLVPADAKRTSATLPSCRCNKAKVLKITNFDQTEEYDEAWSLVDENFVYRRGHWVTVDNFNEDRWYDSTTGIHFWLTREEAMVY